jgi:mono/diheme cytochrome c family protein
MKLLKLVVLAVLVALFAAACSKSEPPPAQSTENKPPSATPPAATPPADQWAAARSLYQASCVKCHKADGTGGEVSFAEGDPPLKVPTFKSERQANEPDAEYIEQIQVGGDGMPGFAKRLSDAQIAQLVAFIRKEFQGKEVKPPTP